MTNVALRVSGFIKTYRTDRGPVGAVRDVDFEIAEGEFYTLLGPSGCGKTTTLRCVAGLERPDSGEIELGGQTVFSSQRRVFVPPHRRELGMALQSYAIWPHMSVFENAAFPLTGEISTSRGSKSEQRSSKLWRWSSSRGWRIAPLHSSAAASSSGSLSRARLCGSRVCCCSTSR